jgi:hypothetical protein
MWPSKLIDGEWRPLPLNWRCCSFEAACWALKLVPDTHHAAFSDDLFCLGVVLAHVMQGRAVWESEQAAQERIRDVYDQLEVDRAGSVLPDDFLRGLRDGPEAAFIKVGFPHSRAM